MNARRDATYPTNIAEEHCLMEHFPLVHETLANTHTYM